MSGRVTRRGLVGKYSFKVGACRLCRFACKHRKCAYNSVKPIDALARYRGTQSARSKRKKTKTTQQMSSRRSKRHKAASESVNALKESKYNDDSTYAVKRKRILVLLVKRNHHMKC